MGSNYESAELKVSAGSEIAAAVEAGRLAASVDDRTVDWTDDGPTSVPIGLSAKGEPVLMKDVLRALEYRRAAPIRQRGSSDHHELESFITHIERSKLPQTTALADVRTFSVEAIYDYNAEGAAAAGWLEHRAKYTCPRSPEWLAWTEWNGKPMSQDVFADFVEARLDDLSAADGFPKPLEVLEMARNLAVHSVGTFQRKVDPTTGTGSLVCKTEHGSESTKIHRAFLLGLRVFEGGQPYAVEARIRFNLTEGRARFQFDLHRRIEIERDAFGDIRKEIADRTGIPVFAGVAEPQRAAGTGEP